VDVRLWPVPRLNGAVTAQRAVPTNFGIRTQSSLNGQVIAFLSTRRPANGGSVLSANDAKAREIKATRFDLWKLAKLADEF
jgi:hypothetical protein